MPENFRGKFQSAVMILADDKGKLPSEIQVLPVGEWDTMPYGKMTVSRPIIDQMVANFNSNIRKAVPVDVDHDGGKAAGWITKLEAKEKGLYATVEWNSYGEELLKNKIYKLFSPEWSFEYLDPENGTQHGAVLVAGSLTNRPLFKELDFIVASDGSKSKNGDLTNPESVMLILSQDNNMNVKELLKKAGGDKSKLTADELKFLKEHESELSDADKKIFLADDEPDETPEEKAEREKREKEQAEADAKAEQDKKDAEAKDAKEKAEADRKANEGKTVTLTASEHAELLKAREENEKRTVADKVGTFVASEKGGKILPKNKDAVVAFAMKCNDSQREDFYKVLEGLPEIKVAGEVGSDENSHLTASEKIVKLIEDKKIELKKANDSLTDGQAEAEAQRIIEKENPNEWKEYSESL